ncbi:MAG: alpha/beta hydrolase [Cellulosilyticaceae bacterium]
MKRLLTAAGITAGIGGMVTYLTGKKIYKETVGFVNKDYQHTSLEEVFKEQPEVVEQLKAYEIEGIQIESGNGYEIEGAYIRSAIPTNRMVVLVTGLGMNMWRSATLALKYLQTGFDVVTFNPRFTGKTGGGNRTFGYYERYDVLAIMKQLRQHYLDYLIGGHGCSMGAATLAMYSGMTECHRDVDFLILDAPYDCMKGAITYAIKGAKVPIPSKLGCWMGDLYNKQKSGFSYNDIKPIEDVKKSQVPMFFIHGDKDMICDMKMSQSMYEQKSVGHKEIWITEGYGHLEACETIADDYISRIMAFIHQISK